MKPSTEKIAKPATKLVPLFRQHSMMQSLRRKTDREKEITLTLRAVVGPYSRGNTNFLPHIVSCTGMLCDEWKLKLYRRVPILSVYILVFFMFKQEG